MGSLILAHGICFQLAAHIFVSFAELAKLLRSIQNVLLLWTQILGKSSKIDEVIVQILRRVEIRMSLIVLREYLTIDFEQQLHVFVLAIRHASPLENLRCDLVELMPHIFPFVEIAPRDLHLLHEAPDQVKQANIRLDIVFDVVGEILNCRIIFIVQKVVVWSHYFSDRDCHSLTELLEAFMAS